MEKVPSIPPKVTFKEFKETAHLAVFGRGQGKMFHVYYGKDDNGEKFNPYWNFLIYPYGFRMSPYDKNTAVNALKNAYRVLFEETDEWERKRSIREGKFKIAISYSSNTDFSDRA